MEKIPIPNLIMNMMMKRITVMMVKVKTLMKNPMNHPQMKNQMVNLAQMMILKRKVNQRKMAIKSFTIKNQKNLVLIRMIWIHNV